MALPTGTRRKPVGKSRRPPPGGAMAAHCRSLPGATEDVKWGGDLMFSVGGKMFAGFDLEAPHECAFKCSEQDFLRLIQKKGITPAPYAARFFWVKVKDRGALSAAELRRCLTKAHGHVLACLSRKQREAVLRGGGLPAQRHRPGASATVDHA